MTRLAVIPLVCVAVAGFFGAKVLASSQPGGIGLPTVTLSTPIATVTVTVPTGTTVPTPTGTVTVPTGTVTVPTGTVTVPTGTVTVPTGTVTVPTGTVTVPTGTVTVPTGTVTVPTGTTVTTPAATVPVTVPSTTVAVTTSVATATVSTPGVAGSTSGVTVSTPGVAGSTPGATGSTQGPMPVPSPTVTVQQAGSGPTARHGATASVSVGSRNTTEPALSASGAVVDGAGSITADGFPKPSTSGGGTSALIPSSGRGQLASSGRGRPAVLLRRLRVERLPGHAKRITVQLSFILSGPARVRFFVFGPAPDCSLAGRFTIAGHAGLNRVPFRGRIRGRLLRSGIYTIVPQSIARAGRPPGPRVAIVIDARGVHPAAPVPWNCRSATKAEPLLPLTPRYAGVAGAIATEPATPADTSATHADTSVDKSRKSGAQILPSVGNPWLTIGVLLPLLASVALLGLAGVESTYAATRFRLVRVVDDRREQIGYIGAALFAGAAVLFLLTQLTT